MNDPTPSEPVTHLLCPFCSTDVPSLETLARQAQWALRLQPTLGASQGNLVVCLEAVLGSLRCQLGICPLHHLHPDPEPTPWIVVDGEEGPPRNPRTDKGKCQVCRTPLPSLYDLARATEAALAEAGCLRTQKAAVARLRAAARQVHAVLMCHLGCCHLAEVPTAAGCLPLVRVELLP